MKFEGSVLKTLLVVVLTTGAVVFAGMNLRAWFQGPPRPDDGVVWVDGSAGVEAQDVRPESPASNAGIQPGQILIAIYHDGAYEQIKRAEDVAYYLDNAGISGSMVYVVERVNSQGVSMGLWEGDVKGIVAAPIPKLKILY